MCQSNFVARARRLPKPLLELCAHLEERGIRTFSHGEGLLDDLRTGGLPPATEPTSRPSELAEPTRSLLCLATPEDVLRALPRAVVTGEGARRITLATSSGPVDLVSTGKAEPEEALLSFGLGPLCIGLRPADEAWCDPADQLRALAAGRLELATADPNPFTVAPRRYWIAARLIAEHGLEPDPALVEAARAAFAESAEQLPQAAPARREISRVLASPNPGPALSFLRESGVSRFLFPGTKPVSEARIAELPALPALRWAAWLRGSATASALVRLRMPHALARRIERIQATHPVEHSVAATRDVGVRKLLQRHDEAEIEALFAWRRLELAADAAAGKPAETIAEAETRLAAIETRIAEVKAAGTRTDQVRALAMDGRSVMDALGAGPGRHVGQALAHLARFVVEHPEANEPAALEAELRDWAAANTNLLD